MVAGHIATPAWLCKSMWWDEKSGVSIFPFHFRIFAFWPLVTKRGFSRGWYNWYDCFMIGWFMACHLRMAKLTYPITPQSFANQGLPLGMMSHNRPQEGCPTDLISQVYNTSVLIAIVITKRLWGWLTGHNFNRMCMEGGRRIKGLRQSFVASGWPKTWSFLLLLPASAVPSVPTSATT